jgi:hypothetical protein
MNRRHFIIGDLVIHTGYHGYLWHGIGIITEVCHHDITVFWMKTKSFNRHSDEFLLLKRKIK